MKSSGGDGEGDGALPAESFFDLLRRAAIFLGQTADRIARVKARRDYSSRNTCSGNYRLSKSDHGIDFDGLWFGRARCDNEGEEMKEAFGINFYSFEMHPVKL